MVAVRGKLVDNWPRELAAGDSFCSDSVPDDLNNRPLADSVQNRKSQYEDFVISLCCSPEP